MLLSRDRLTLLPGGLPARRPAAPAVARLGDSSPFVDAVLTVQERGRRAAAAVTLVPGADGRWLGQIGLSWNLPSGGVLSVDALLDALLDPTGREPRERPASTGMRRRTRGGPGRVRGWGWPGG